MDLENAKRILAISDFEKQSIQRYLGYKHASINFLANINEDIYERMSRSGWRLPSNKEELKQCIDDFVNIYSAMYKNSKNSKAHNLKLIRGTNTTDIRSLHTTTNQFLSSSTDEYIAKRFCEYNNAALVRISLEDGVPFLYAETFREEHSSNEMEYIIAPFCKISDQKLVSKWNDYSYYQLSLKKPQLQEKSTEEISTLLEDILDGFQNNINDLQECNRLKDSQELYEMKYNRAAGNKNDQQDILKAKHQAYKDYMAKLKVTHDFKDKMNQLLQGLCRQKELSIDEAYNIIDQERQRQAELLEKQRQAKLKEEARAKSIESYLSATTIAKNSSVSLGSNVKNTFLSMSDIEKKYMAVYKLMEIPYLADSINNPNTIKDISLIQSNLNNILLQVESQNIDSNSSIDDIATTSKQLSPFMDGVSYGTEVAKDFPDIVELYEKQCLHSLTKSIYEKAHKLLQNEKLKKYTNERNVLSAKKIGFFGTLLGKKELNDLKIEELGLKMNLSRDIPEPKDGEYSIKDVLAEIVATSQTEFNGVMPIEIQSLYNTIRNTFMNQSTKKPFSDELINELASNKIAEQQSNLPITQNNKTPKFFGKRKFEIEQARAKNNNLRNRISQRHNHLSYIKNSTDPDAISWFRSKLDIIAKCTRGEQISSIKDLEDTVDLFKDY